jgi:hypothetical protein
MTSAVISPVEQTAIESRAAAGPPRKRRRRTAGGGAADDCFTCRKRAAKCDRKRPYCTQCIDIGKECSGYKTTLTWGVGGASRGKLRGLSCPIANKNVDGSDVGADDNASRRRKSSVSFVKKEEVAPEIIQGTMAPLVSIPDVTMHGQVSLPPATLPIPVPQQRNGWQIPGFQEHIQARHDDQMRNVSLNLPPLHQLQTGLSPQFNQSIPGSAMSVASYPETEYYSPMEHPQTPGSMSFGDPLPNPYADQPLTATSGGGFSLSAASTDSYADSIDALRSNDYMDNVTISPQDAQLSPLDGMIFNTGEPSYNGFDVFATQDDDLIKDEVENTLALFDSRFSNPFFHLTPRLQSLMEYYDRYICPFLVAFDGPQNPYRKHVLQLAVNNEGLQNAIAALATNNLRMRKKQTLQLGFVEELTEAFDGSDGQDTNEASAEETMYKQMSIDQLNMQLIHARAAQDDSVLATLLILCLFHVCDSGFSKFKTQLAGVQKLLSLRNPTVQSEFTGWVEMFFTWFDVMTSTVNDREMQIKGESLDMLDYSANLGALEQFSGCDGRLFKIIARLGRRKRPTAKMLANRSLSPSDFDHLDGNGWGTPIISSDEDADGSMDEDTPFGGKDDRKEFWKQWHDIRKRLQEWEMDPTNVPASAPNIPSDPAQLDAGQRDLVHINESFRFSALLYTERLGNPLLPSSHQQFQTLVSQALSHISALSITSCVNKFLLWPLFITGTECVDEAHRNIVRTRCIEVQKESGFFNNISSLEVLEKVWQEVGSNVAGKEESEIQARRRDSEVGVRFGRGKYAQAFRWRKAMDRVDGEYIVI